MKFRTRTAAPTDRPLPKPDRSDEIKDLLFAAVRIYVEDHEGARDELLALLGESEAGQVAS